jgi:transcriptional regulator with XRE-family HTH domain
MKIRISQTALAAIETKQERSADGLPALMFELRKLSGFSQQDVADVLGMKRVSITNMENGKQPITFSNLDKFAEHLGLEVRVEIVAKELE